MALKYSPGGLINVADPGSGFLAVTPGMSASDTFARLKAISDAKAPNTTVLLNPGSYNLSQTWEFYTGVKNASHQDQPWIRGSGMTKITGNFSGPLVAYNAAGLDAATDARISGIEFQNGHATGICLQLERIEKAVLACLKFTASAAGLVIGSIQPTNTDIDCYDIDLNGDLTAFPAGIGMSCRMLGRVFGLRATQCGVATRFANHVDCFGGRVEECNVGMQFGTYGLGAGTEYSTVGLLHGYTNESTVRNVQMQKGCTSLSIGTYQSHGTGNGTFGNPVKGIDMQAGSGRLTLANAQVNGSFSTAAVYLDGDGTAVLINNAAGIKSPAVGVPWFKGANVTVVNVGSNYP